MLPQAGLYNGPIGIYFDSARCSGPLVTPESATDSETLP